MSICTASVASAFVISPSQIELPALTEHSSFVVDLVSDTTLSLSQTNCTTATITLQHNQLAFTTPQYASKSLEVCAILVAEEEKPSVSFSFTVSIHIVSTLASNMSISYADSHLEIRNLGNGSGTVWLQTGADSHVVPCVLDPQEVCTYEPQGYVRVCHDAACTAVLFAHTFTPRNTNDVDHNLQKTKKETPLLYYGLVAVVLLFIIGSIGLYFARRNRTFLKDTS